MNIKTLQYLIHFLLGDDVSKGIYTTIGYTSDQRLFHKYNIVIIPSGFFEDNMYGKTASVPSLPLQEIEGIPLLFGSPHTEMVGATLVVYADIIASAFFLITRYEEIIKRQVRDEHGRFPGKESLPYRAGFLHRPIVDEYRLLLRRWLRQTGISLPEKKREIQKIYLTHDIDAPFLYRSWKGFVRSLLDGRGVTTSIRGKWGDIKQDPYYTFPAIQQQKLFLQESVGKKRCQSIYFFRAGGKTPKDKPHYHLQNKDIQRLMREISDQQDIIGLHSSYQAGQTPQLIPAEKERLEKALNKKVFFNRHHFLACREPEDMSILEAANITDDFTMGYADVAGFRLGTSYPVRWINPVTRRLSQLTLHPLPIMDSMLKETKYMGLSYEEALAYCRTLIENARQAGGEFTLLWHNTSFVDTEESYLNKLYTGLLNELIQR